MGTDTATALPMPENLELDFKVLVEFDNDYGVFVARCLDTDAVATGSTEQEATDQIKKTLELDIRLAHETGGLESLFHVKADGQYWDRWHRAKSADPGSVQTEHIDVQGPMIKRRQVGSILIAKRISAA